MTIKTKINKWDLNLKVLFFGTAKETLKKMKRQPTEWEKIFANEPTEKGLISKIYKHLLQQVPISQSFHIPQCAYANPNTAIHRSHPSICPLW